jgi:ABC-type glutathione transport system ATPase component
MCPAEDMNLLEIRDLTVSYANDRALDRIDLQVGPAQVLGLLGSSGSGKSTLAMAVLGILPARARIESGTILFRGEDLLRAEESRLRSLRGAAISMVFQEPATALNPVLRVGDQVAEVIAAHSTHSHKECRQLAHERLREMQFAEAHQIYNAYPHELSGGQRQRVVLAQAFACRPSLVIADEPTSAADSVTQAEIVRLMRSMVKTNAVAMILITHNPLLLSGFADRVAVIHSGRLLEEGPVEQVLRQPQHEYTQSLLACVPTKLWSNGTAGPATC